MVPPSKTKPQRKTSKTGRRSGRPTIEETAQLSDAVREAALTQDLSVTANMSDRAFRFMQKTQRFRVYPLPTRGAYFRDFIFTPDGRVCASSSPMPPRSEVVEGGMDSLMCIETNDAPTTHSDNTAHAR